MAALVIDGVFKHATFCKFVCPIGQFNFVASTVSPLEVSVRDQDVCAHCDTKDCIRGRRDQPAGPDFVVLQRGCELALFQPLKVGNMDCTFCLDCVHACPHDNVGVLSRVPAAELMSDPMRSGIGLFSRRKDIAALAMVFTFRRAAECVWNGQPGLRGGGLAERLAARAGRKRRRLALIFAFFLVVEPMVLAGIGGVADASVAAAISRRSCRWRCATRYALAPLGFGMWLAHYGFHFFSGLYTLIPVTQNALADLGWPFWARRCGHGRDFRHALFSRSNLDFCCWGLRDRCW